MVPPLPKRPASLRLASLSSLRNFGAWLRRLDKEAVGEESPSNPHQQQNQEERRDEHGSDDHQSEGSCETLITNKQGGEEADERSFVGSHEGEVAQRDADLDADLERPYGGKADVRRMSFEPDGAPLLPVPSPLPREPHHEHPEFRDALASLHEAFPDPEEVASAPRRVWVPIHAQGTGMMKRNKSMPTVRVDAPRLSFSMSLSRGASGEFEGEENADILANESDAQAELAGLPRLASVKEEAEEHHHHHGHHAHRHKHDHHGRRPPPVRVASLGRDVFPPPAPPLERRDSLVLAQELRDEATRKKERAKQAREGRHSERAWELERQHSIRSDTAALESEHKRFDMLMQRQSQMRLKFHARQLHQSSPHSPPRSPSRSPSRSLSTPQLSSPAEQSPLCLGAHGGGRQGGGDSKRLPALAPAATPTLPPELLAQLEQDQAEGPDSDSNHGDADDGDGQRHRASATPHAPQRARASAAQPCFASAPNLQ